MEHPLMRGWDTLVRYPALALVPLGWEAITVGSASLLGLVSHSVSNRPRFQLPAALPGGADLLGTSLLSGGLAERPGQWLLFAATALLGAMVTAGFLHLIAQAMQGRPPSWFSLVDGMQRHGFRLVQWRLLLVLGALVLPWAVLRMPWAAALAVGLVIVVAMAYLCLVEFLIPVQELTLREAIAASPRLFSQRFGALLLTGIVSLLLSGCISYALIANHLRTLLIASPLWCFFGTWMTASICAVISEAC